MHGCAAATLPELHVPNAVLPPHVGHDLQAAPQKPAEHALHAAPVQPAVHEQVAPAVTFFQAPAPHAAHVAALVALVAALNLSVPQDVHAMFPAPAAYVPTPHGAHGVAPLDTKPAEHALHDVAELT